MSSPLISCRLVPIVALGLLLAQGSHAQNAQRSGEIVINEILYNPADDGEHLEFVELFNRSDRTVDLSRYTLADANRDPTALPDTAPPLPPGGYAVLVRDGAAFQATFPGVPFIKLSDWPTLNNGGDTVFILHADGIVDSVAYTPDWGGADGHSLERIDPDGPARAFNFGTSTAGATPGRQNSLFAPDKAPPQPIFAEQEGDRNVTVFFSEPLAPPSVAPGGFSLDGGRMPVSAVLLEGGTRVRLAFAGAFRGGALTVRSVRDFFGNVLQEADVPVAVQPQPGEVIINEILYAPLADDFDNRPDQPEYVELYNRTDYAITLRGAFWTDRPDEEGKADTLRFGDARLEEIAPGGYAVVYARAEPGILEAAFPALDTAATRLTLIGLGRSSLGLLNGGSLIYLHRADGQVADSVQYDPDWHAPALEDDTGVALERLAPAGPSNAPANWTSSVAKAGGTPGQSNSVSLPPGEPPPTEHGLEIAPSPFSPDGDGTEDVAAIRYTLDQRAALLRLRIFDSYGRQVYSVEAERAGHTGQLLWNGRDDAGRRLKIGIYVVLLEALNAEGGTVTTLKAPVVLARPLN